MQTTVVEHITNKPGRISLTAHKFVSSNTSEPTTAHKFLSLPTNVIKLLLDFDTNYLGENLIEYAPGSMDKTQTYGAN